MTNNFSNDFEDQSKVLSINGTCEMSEDLPMITKLILFQVLILDKLQSSFVVFPSLIELVRCHPYQCNQKSRLGDLLVESSL